MSMLETRAAPATSLQLGYDKKLMVFSGRANPELGAKIADKLGIAPGPITLKTFTHREVYCRFDESIRGADVFLIHPTCGNAEAGITTNNAIMELMLMIDPSNAASTHRVI